MPKKSKGAPAAASLPAFDKDDKSLVHVIIETPKGCRNKYKFDPEMAEIGRASCRERV